MTPEEYVAFERASASKHEYADGEVFAMSGGTREHSLLGANVIVALAGALRDQPCEVHGSDLRVHIPATGRYVYPDVVVVCGQPAFTDENRDTLLNPKVVIEVLSDSSEAYDRGEKFEHYQTVATLTDYLLVSQKKARIEHFRRQADGAWLLLVAGPAKRLALQSIACEIAVDEVYRRIFEAAGT